MATSPKTRKKSTELKIVPNESVPRLTESSSLIKTDDGMRVSSIGVAEHLGTTYRSTHRLINTYQTKLESFGEVRFEITPTGQKKHALLNEDQAIFLVTLSRNTGIVVDAKLWLVTEFSKLRRKQAAIDANHAKVEWHQHREQGKTQRKQLTDEIKQFVEYAAANGSKSATRYYTSITRMIQSTCGIEKRDEATPDQLAVLAIAEIAAERELKRCLSLRVEYHKIYRDVKTAVFNQVLALPEVA